MTSSAKAELDAMSAVAGALEPLDDQDAVRRVLTWAGQHFLGSATGATAEDPGVETPPPEATSAAAHGHETFAEFFNAASPATLEDKVLIAAYWAQEVEKREPLFARHLNNLLNDLGEKIDRITDVFDALKERKPAPVVRLRKSGESRQARKSYKMTEAGTRAVKEMPSSNEG